MYNRIISNNYNCYLCYSILRYLRLQVNIVNWNDDGTVTLTHEDGTEILIDRATLGAAYGPDDKPFEGETITILALDSGPKGGISGPLYSARPIWEELSGATG